MKSIIPLTTIFRADKYYKAFILNALVSAVIAASAVEMRVHLKDPNLFPHIRAPGENDESMIVFFTALFAALLIYHIMYFVFGFGGGMLVSSRPIKYF